MTGNPTGEEVVHLDSVTVRFGRKLAVDRLSFSVHAGERVAILGRTGAGKSTVLNLLVGNLKPDAGSVRVDGLDPYHQHRALQGRIGMAFQTPNLLPWRTAQGNARIGLEILGHPKEYCDQVARQWLERMHLGGAEHLYPSQLSGGMRQRTSLARAFAIQPKLIMLDESFSALDEVTARNLRADFLALCQDSHTTALLVTHSIEEAFYLATRVLVFGSPAVILAEYETAPYADPAAFNAVRQEIHKAMENGGSRSPATNSSTA